MHRHLILQHPNGPEQATAALNVAPDRRILRATQTVPHHLVTRTLVYAGSRSRRRAGAGWRAGGTSGSRRAMGQSAWSPNMSNVARAMSTHGHFGAQECSAHGRELDVRGPEGVGRGVHPGGREVDRALVEDLHVDRRPLAAERAGGVVIAQRERAAVASAVLARLAAARRRVADDRAVRGDRDRDEAAAARLGHGAGRGTQAVRSGTASRAAAKAEPSIRTGSMMRGLPRPGPAQSRSSFDRGGGTRPSEWATVTTQPWTESPCSRHHAATGFGQDPLIRARACARIGWCPWACTPTAR